MCGIQKKWYKWSFFARRNRDIDMENKYMDTKGESPGSNGTIWEIGIDVYTFDTVYKIDN